MNDSLTLTLRLTAAWLAGGALGAIFFGGLWWTVRKSVTARQPALWMFCSLLLRMGIVLPGFYFVAGGYWERALTCLLGFVMARFIVTWLASPPIESIAPSMKESHHAP